MQLLWVTYKTQHIAIYVRENMYTFNNKIIQDKMLVLN